MSNKHHKQPCPSQNRCQVCSGFHHTVFHDAAKQIKRPTAFFSTEVFSGSNPTASTSSKASRKTPNTSQQKNQIKKAPTAVMAKRSPQNVQRRNLNIKAINQSFSFNQRSETQKNLYEELQLISVSFLKGDKAFDTYALIEPGSQFSFVLDTIAEFLELPVKLNGQYHYNFSIHRTACSSQKLLSSHNNSI